MKVSATLESPLGDSLKGVKRVEYEPRSLVRESLYTSDINQAGRRIPLLISEMVVKRNGLRAKSSRVKKFPDLKSGLKTGLCDR